MKGDLGLKLGGGKEEREVHEVEDDKVEVAGEETRGEEVEVEVEEWNLWLKKRRRE